MIQRPCSSDLDPVYATFKSFSSRCYIDNVLGLEDFIEILTYREIRKRLAAFILILMKNTGVHTPNGITTTLKFSHVQIARIIGSTRPTISKLVRNMEDTGIILICSGGIIVYDPVYLSNVIN
uniref:global nitrogen transcriptional regulator n=1 Tax=Timspurckia oligopyrenoides TaxID=708627 RepID=UPI001FCDE464|nr:global nitrogen transcriptional regulator [Timspurckia oligopyrenoides]UNJ17533.1 global nitrogen transcriptional regulator [Timspurckia oligopyrenoides]